MKPKIVGILNITEDSFSDGGQYLDPQQAIERAVELNQLGAAIIDIGAESTHPDSRKVTVQEEIRLLEPVITGLKSQYPDLQLSVDTHKAEVMQACLRWGVDMINDVTSLKSVEAQQVVAASSVPLVLMYSRSPEAHAQKEEGGSEGIISEIKRFFEMKIIELEQRGINKDRLILDPGMGFFLGANPEPSLEVLKQLSQLRELGCPLYLCTSRKSFLGTLTGKSALERGAATLASELWATSQGIDYLRTHDVGALHDALLIWESITN